MPRLATKHSGAEIVTRSDFTGGLNLSRPPDSIDDNELQEAVNFEFEASTGLLCTRLGLAPVHEFPWRVSDIIPSPEMGVVLVRSGDLIYRVLDGEVTHIGEVEGSGPASYEQWGDGEKRNSLLLAFGKRLYLYCGDEIQVIGTEGAPEAAEVVFARSGRVIVAESGSDTIRYSGVGDPFRWTEDTDGDSVSVSVGYKDGCSTRAIAALAGELIIFKAPDGQPEHGRIYRLQGDYPNWSIIPFSRGASAWNRRSVLNVGGDVLFLTREGLANVATATEYGDFKLGWAGKKINSALSRELSEACRLWHMPIRNQVWLSGGAGGACENVWCYHYNVGGGAWTTLRFPQPVTAAAPAHGSVYVAMGNTLYMLSEAAPDDAGLPLEASLKLKTVTGRNQTLLKGVTVHYQSTPDAEAHMLADRFCLPLPCGGQVGGEDVAYYDSDIAYHDPDYLVAHATNLTAGVVRRRCVMRRWSVTPEIRVMNGRFNLSMLGLEVTEV